MEEMLHYLSISSSTCPRTPSLNIVRECGVLGVLSNDINIAAWPINWNPKTRCKISSIHSIKLTVRSLLQALDGIQGFQAYQVYTCYCPRF